MRRPGPSWYSSIETIRRRGGKTMQMFGVHRVTRRAILVPAIAVIAGLFALPGAPPVSAQGGETGYDATVPPAGIQHVKQVTVVAHDTAQEIAPGVKVPLWTFNGSVPAPVIHVRQGDEVKVSFANKTPLAHSIDFHA